MDGVPCPYPPEASLVKGVRRAALWLSILCLFCSNAPTCTLLSSRSATAHRRRPCISASYLLQPQLPLSPDLH